MIAGRVALLGLLLLLGCEGRRAESAKTELSSSPVAASERGGNPPALDRIDPSRICVESGRVDPATGGLLAVRTAGMRAYASSTQGDAVELAFTYRGPSQESAPLASGELRRQIGLKLRARDTCNVVYVTWHVAPTSGIHASVKSNPGKSTHAECGDRGYINLKPSWTRDVPAIQPGERHTLAARIEGRTLRVSVDGAPAWEGALPAEAFLFDGPVGIRSDNGEFDLDLRAAAGRGQCPAGTDKR